MIKQCLKRLYFYGNIFYCPCCGAHLRHLRMHKQLSSINGKLLDYSADNEICPLCYSYSRHRFLLTFLKHHTPILREKTKVLHFAPEPGIYSFFRKQKNIEYIACDLQPALYPGAIKVDCTKIQFPDKSVDGVIASHVFEHIVPDTQALHEVYRIIRPGGWAVIAVPVRGEETLESPGLDYCGREKMFGWGEHVRMYGLDFKRKLISAGFSVNLYSYCDVPGNYIDRSVTSPLLEDNKYIFFARK